MRNAKGYAVVTMPDDMRETVVNFGNGAQRVKNTHGVYEVDTFACAHCGSIEHVEAKADVNAVGFCKKCMKPICRRCSSLPCSPYERELELIEAKSGITNRPLF